MSEPLCQFLDWDSQFFGYRIARARVNHLTPESAQAIQDWCMEQAIDCLYFLARSDKPATIRLAEDNEFQLVEIRLDFERKIEGWDPATRPRANPEIQVRPAQAQDIPTLQDIAANSYINTRYYFDERFPKSKCQELYRIWIKRSCEGNAQMALVAEMNGQIQGYISGYRSAGKPEGHFDLTGVRHDARRAGIGQELFRSGLDWYARASVEHILVTTQGRNIGTQRMIERNGFISRDCQLYYHKWFSEC
ncbi:GNAT family N-acetyltransferase [Chloroflexota bacterium]